MDAHRPTTSAPAPREPSERGALQRTAWRLLSSPVTLVVLGVLGGVFLSVAAFLPAELGRGGVATSLGFGLAEVISGLGLSNPLGSWLFWLLVLLAVLHLVARSVAPGGPHALGSTSVTVAVDGAPDELTSRVARLAGRAAFMRSPDGGALYLRRGAQAEGGVLLGLGMVALVGAFVMHARQPLDARLITPLGAADFGATRAKVIVDGIAIDRSLPFGLVCNAPDPLDPTRAMGCLFRGPGEGDAPAEIVLRPGTRTRVGDLSLTPHQLDRDVPTSADTPLRILDQRGSPRRITLEPGLPHALPGVGGEVLIGDRVGGIPFVVTSDAANTAPRVLIPSALESTGDDALTLLPPATLTVRVRNEPPTWLFWLSLAIIAGGLIVWVAVPDLAVSARPDTGAAGRTLVTLSSTNRPALLGAWVAALSGPPRGDREGAA